MGGTMESTAAVLRCDWRTFITASDDSPAALTAALDRHFSHYCQPTLEPVEGGKPKLIAECPKCGKPLSGLEAFFRGGGFTWGIIHGEGHCSACRWPATGHHFIRDEAGKELVAIRDFPLAVHPDFVTEKAQP